VIDDVRGASLEATERLRELVCGVNGSIEDLTQRAVTRTVAVPSVISIPGAKKKRRRRPRPRVARAGFFIADVAKFLGMRPQVVSLWSSRDLAKPTPGPGWPRFSAREGLILWAMKALGRAGLLYEQGRPMAESMVADYIADAGKTVFTAHIEPGVTVTIDLGFAPRPLLVGALTPE
jgi:hypothetical protein